MIWLITAVSIFVPFLALLMRVLLPSMSLWLDLLAVLSLHVFGIQAAAAVAGILLRDTVMMTEVHRIFYSPTFLAAGAYLGLYAYYRSWLTLFRRFRRE